MGEVNWSAVRQLDPVIQQVVCYPVNKGVDAETAWFDTGVGLEFGLGSQFARDDPVVFLFAEDFSAETELVSARKCSELL